MTAPAAIPGRIAVAGPGVYGSSFAAWAARCGLDVRLVGRNRDHAEAGRARIQDSWRARVAKGRMTQAEAEAATGRLAAASTLESALDGAEALVEAFPEDLLDKAAFWSRLGAWGGLRLSGSSSIPMAELARAAGLPQPPLGFHGFVPVDRMRVVELVVPEGVPEASARRAEGLAGRLGLAVARVRDQAGFAAARMALAQGLEAMRLLETGAAGRDALDTLMAAGYGHPVGPLELSDRVGLHLRLAIAERLHRETGSPAFEPPGILRDLVAQGRTGRAAGRGFYEWDAQGGKR